MFAVYKITNVVTHGIYIGKSKDPQYRWHCHKYDARNDAPRYYVHRAMKKHGVESFTFEILSWHETESEAFAEERKQISCARELNLELYNMTSGGDGPLGYRHTDETKRKIGEANKKRAGKPGKIPDAVTRKRLSDGQRQRYASGKPNPMLGRRGEASPRGKLTLADAALIRERHMSGSTFAELAAEFQVSRFTISRVCKGQAYT